MITKTIYPLVVVAFTLGCIIMYQSCTHDPFIDDDMEPDPMDTMSNPMDTMSIDTMDMDTTMMEEPCDTNIVYFQNEILPILNGNCAFSGCHDASTASDGVILDSYDNIINTAEVVAFNLSDSKLYEVITEDDPEELMPPTGKLDNASINLIAIWILQGAENNMCEANEGCNTTEVSYNDFVKGVFSTSCNGCHSTSAAFGGVILDTYEDVLVQVNNGKLFGAINWEQGFQRMPQGQDQLDSCTIAKIKSWIDEGAQDN